MKAADHGGVRGRGERSGGSIHSVDATPETSRRWIVDRIEERLVVVQTEDGTALDIPLWLLPADVREGDVITIATTDSGSVRRLELRIDEAATEAAFEEAKRLLGRMGRSP